MTTEDTPKAFGLNQLTESEVLAAARSVRELQALRSLQGICGKISLGTASIPLEADETSACISLLIERHTVLLANLGIIPDAAPA